MKSIEITHMKINNIDDCQKWELKRLKRVTVQLEDLATRYE
jgi:hypothetical protein